MLLVTLPAAGPRPSLGPCCLPACLRRCRQALAGSRDAAGITTGAGRAQAQAGLRRAVAGLGAGPASGTRRRPLQHNEAWGWGATWHRRSSGTGAAAAAGTQAGREAGRHGLGKVERRRGGEEEGEAEGGRRTGRGCCTVLAAHPPRDAGRAFAGGRTRGLAAARGSARPTTRVLLGRHAQSRVRPCDRGHG